LAELNTDVDQQIKEIEDDLIRAQQLDLKFKGDRNAVWTVANAAATRPSYYTNSQKLDKLIGKVRGILNREIAKAGSHGRIMGRNAINRFLDDSERRTRMDRLRNIAKRSSAKRAGLRVDAALTQLNKEAGILKADIDVFKANARAAGFTNKEILDQLIQVGGSKAGPMQAFAKRANAVARDAARRARSQEQIGVLRQDFPRPNDMWQWITVSTKPCPDCSLRAGKVLSWAEWEQIGTPGSGHTVCGSACKCLLQPIEIAERRFPTVKEFRFDPERGVLTTASEARKLNKKTAQPPQNKGKNGDKTTSKRS